MDWNLESGAAPIATAGRAVIGDGLDAYEAWMQSLTEAQRELARLAGCARMHGLGSVWSDAGRDVTAIQLSLLRWWLLL